MAPSVGTGPSEHSRAQGGVSLYRRAKGWGDSPALGAPLCFRILWETEGGSTPAWWGEMVTAGSAAPRGPLPHHAVVVYHLPRRHHGATEVAGTGLRRHAGASIVQEGATGAGAAIHGHEADTAGDVCLAQGAAGGLAAIHHVGVFLGLGAAAHVLGWGGVTLGSELGSSLALLRLSWALRSLTQFPPWAPGIIRTRGCWSHRKRKHQALSETCGWACCPWGPQHPAPPSW